MRKRSRYRFWILSILLFLLAFLPRAIQPVSRPLVWYLRSAHFARAVLAGDWADTVYSEHPGVGLMWPVGAALRAYWALSGVTPAAESVPPDFEPIHFFGPVPVAEIAAGVAALAFLIGLGIVGVYLLARRLFDEATAAVAALLLSVSPYFVTQSKVLHLDAWMAILMLLSALALLVYRRERRFPWLLLSGVLGGLSLLVKTTALFLVPFAGLVLLVDYVCNSPLPLSPRPSPLAIRNLGSAAGSFLIWLLVIALIYGALWPVMWVEPERGLGAVKWGITHHATTAHDTPTFFLDRMVMRDPGPLFYVVSLLFRGGEVELTFLIVAMALGAVSLLRRRRLGPKDVDRLLLLAYAFFFLAQMCLGAKKMPRYVLPALLALDLLAATGIVAWARRLAGGRRKLARVLMALPLVVQAGLILPRHPYYGTAFNWVAGGPPAAARAILTGEEGEGLADLAAYLNARPDAEALTVAAQLKHVFNQYFRGTTVDIDQPADYLAFHRNYTVRDYKIDMWGDLWERYSARTPEREVRFDGVPYAWLYRALPPDVAPEHAMVMSLGDHFRFLGYDLRRTGVAPGERVPVVLYWQATQPVTDDLSIFVHLLDPAGQLVWQDDGGAAHGERPVWSWTEDEVIVDPHTVPLPHDLPAGEYALTVGLYDWRSGDRLEVADPSGAGGPWDRITVATLDVRAPSVSPWAWVARGAAGLVLLSALVVVWRRDE